MYFLLYVSLTARGTVASCYSSRLNHMQPKCARKWWWRAKRHMHSDKLLCAGRWGCQPDDITIKNRNDEFRCVARSIALKSAVVFSKPSKQCARRLRIASQVPWE